MIQTRVFLDSINEFVYLQLTEEQLKEILITDYDTMLCALNASGKRFIIPKCDIRIVEEV